MVVLCVWFFFMYHFEWLVIILYNYVSSMYVYIKPFKTKTD